MFLAGKLAFTVCPSRVLAEAGWTTELIDWWLWSTTWNGAKPAGPPRWPFRGGLLRQPARLVQAVKIIHSEWPNLSAAAVPES